jgi:hypothetical protein
LKILTVFLEGEFSEPPEMFLTTKAVLYLSEYAN